MTATTATDVTVAIRIGLTGTFAATPQTVYVWFVDAAWNGTGWVQATTWTLVAQQPPAYVSGSPSTSSTAPQAFIVTARDQNGATDIQRIYFLVNTSPSIPQNVCHGFYDRASNTIYLFNDALTVLNGPLTPGSAGTLSNSQCTIYGTGSGVTATTATDITLALRMGLNGAFASTAQNVYVWITDVAATGTGWVQMATWSLVAPQPPTYVSGSPSSSAASLHTSTFTARDQNGATDIQRIYFLVNTSPSTPQNVCHGFYDRPSNAIYLFNDALTVLNGPLTPGSAGTLSNSQCTIYGSGSVVTTTTATDITLALRMGLNGTFAATAQNVYVWITDAAGTGTGWVQMATWAIAGPPATMSYSTTPESIGGGGSCVLTAHPPVYTIQRANGNQINISARMSVNGPIQGNWRVTVRLFVFFSGQSFGHGIPDATVNFSSATPSGTQYGPIGSVSLEPRGSGAYHVRAATWGVCNGQTIYYQGPIADSSPFPVQRPAVFVPDSAGNPTGLTSADFWYLNGAPSTDGYYTQYRLAMNPNTTPGQGTHGYSWITNDNSKLDLIPENPATKVIIVSKGSSTPGYPSGEITVKASLNGFTSLAFQVRINAPHRLRMGNNGTPFNETCSTIYGSPAYIGYQSGYVYNILDLTGAVLTPIITHETLENRKVVVPGGSSSNWATMPSRGTWTPGNPDHWGQIDNAWAFIDNYRVCSGPTLIELTPLPFDPTPNAPAAPVVNFTQKFWVGTTTPEATNTFTGKCVQRNTALLRQSIGSVDAIVSPATSAQCASGVFVN